MHFNIDTIGDCIVGEGSGKKPRLSRVKQDIKNAKARARYKADPQKIRDRVKTAYWKDKLKHAQQ